MAMHAVVGGLVPIPLPEDISLHEQVPVRVNVDVIGIESLKKYWAQLPAQLRRAAAGGAYHAAFRVLEAANDTVPHRTGLTMESGRIQVGSEDIDNASLALYGVVYDTEYAWKIHETTWYNFAQPGEMRPGAYKPVPPSDRGWRGAKWLERASAEIAPQYEDIVGSAIRDMLDKQEAASRARIAQAGKGPPRLVKKGTTSGGMKMADVPIYTPPKPGHGGSIDEVRSEAMSMNWAKATGVRKSES
ncbi:MAG: hypothetical protein EHM35_09325 [Planctomycetaceae bacterium]|nr:MAG: hypothetical protein EHM35_09325 [Planctomycetaceae bacterium]